MRVEIQIDNNPYAFGPIEKQKGIPIFSKKDGYVENYMKIASDHVAQITEAQENPFMEEAMWRSLEDSTRKLIQKYAPKGGRILDVGVGLGRLIEPLNDYERYGVDISLDYLSIAKQRGIEVALAKIEELPYKRLYFDVITVCDVLEHVFDLNYCTEKILACLKPGGVLIVRTPFKENLDVYLGDDIPYEFVHLRNFDEGSLRLHFQKIFGLQFLEALTTTPYLQGTPRLKIRLLPKETCNRLKKLALRRPKLWKILSALAISEESFQSWLYELKDKDQELFEDLSEDLIYGIEINAVFRKPQQDDDKLKNMRSK